MRSILFLMLITPSLFLGQELRIHSPFSGLKNGNYHLFGDNVKFRTAPDLDSEFIGLLKFGEEVEITAKTSLKTLFNGIEYPFYKVKYKGQEGYINGGLLSPEKVKTEKNNYFFSLKMNDDGYFLILRYLDSQNEIKEIETALYTNEFTIKTYNNRGLEGVEEVIYIDYFAEACGVNGGGIYFFRIKDELRKTIEISQVSDAGVFWNFEELIFPNDKNGVNGKIVFEKEVGVYKDDEETWMQITKNIVHLEWKNGKLSPLPNFYD
jgi:hypothetical protein